MFWRMQRYSQTRQSAMMHPRVDAQWKVPSRWRMWRRGFNTAAICRHIVSRGVDTPYACNTSTHHTQSELSPGEDNDTCLIMKVIDKCITASARILSAYGERHIPHACKRLLVARSAGCQHCLTIGGDHKPGSMSNQWPDADPHGGLTTY